MICFFFFFFSSRRRHTRCLSDWSSDVCSSDLGDMSLVGPRPERPEFVPSLEQAVPRYRDRLLVRPGLTGLRSEERRVGRECRSQGGRHPYTKKRIDLHRVEKSTILEIAG